MASDQGAKDPEPERLARGVEVLFDVAYDQGLLAGDDMLRKRAHHAALRPRCNRLNLRFDVLVIGSGYGGAVTAARLASTGKRVAVLERGREYLPGEFPDDVHELPRHVRTSSAGADEIRGLPEALFDVRTGDGINVVVGNALGGTSQINANVVIEPTLDAFDASTGGDGEMRFLWPDEIRKAAARVSVPDEHCVETVLADAYDVVRRMLGAKPHPGRATLGKYQALERLAAALAKTQRGSDSVPTCRPLDLAVAFAAGTNAQGVHQGECTNCGNCVTGCNYWAKSTLTMNYLPLARRFGAELYTGARVTAIEPSERRTGSSRCKNDWGGVRGKAARWIVHVERAADENASDTTAQLELYADVVVLAAGTLGSTEILLRSQNLGFLACSEALGSRFSGNGDMVAMGYRQTKRAGGIGRPAWVVRQSASAPPGPTAVGVIDLRASQDERFIIEDGAIPYALEWFFREIAATSGLLAQLTRWRLRTTGSPHGTDPLAADRASAEHTMTYLLMGHESGFGSLELAQDKDVASSATDVDLHVQQAALRSPSRLEVHWPHAAAEPLFESQQSRLARAFRADDDLGILLHGPAWKPIPDSLTALMGGEPPRGAPTTVHPLGGCPMGDTRETGAVDHAGQVFRADVADPCARYAGLYVADGSIVPASLGANPLLTIAALAERAAVIIARRETLGPIRTQVPRNSPDLPAPYADATRRAPVEVARYKPTRLLLKEALAEEWGGVLARALAQHYGIESQSAATQRLRLTFDLELRDPCAERDFSEWLAHADRAAEVWGHARIEQAPENDAEPLQLASFEVTGTFGFLHERMSRAAVAGAWPKSHMHSGSIIVRALRYAHALSALLRVRLGREITQQAAAIFRRAVGRAPARQDHHAGGFRLVWARARALLPYLAHMSRPRYLTYEIRLTPAHNAGTTVRLHGEKILAFRNWRSSDDDPAQLPGSPWLQIGEVPLALELTPEKGRVLGRVRVDIAKLVQTHQPQIESAFTAMDGYQGLASFGLLFARAVLERHVHSFKAPAYPTGSGTRSVPPGPVAGLTRPEQHWLDVNNDANGDGMPRVKRTRSATGTRRTSTARILLTRYRAPLGKQDELERREPLLFIHGFLHSGLIFAGDLKPGRNAVQFFCERGFDVWVVEMRTSTALATAADQWSYDDVALCDVPEAVDYVLARTGYEQVSIVAHCMGAAAFSMAALDGRLDRSAFLAGGSAAMRHKIRCAVLSQVGPLIEPTTANRARGHAARFIGEWLARRIVDVAPHGNVTWREALADRLAYSFPVPESHRKHHRDGWWKPRVDVALCNRLTMMIGRNWEHENLASETHARLSDVLGVGNVTSFLQLAKFMVCGSVTDELGQNWFCIDTLARQHLGFPILFLSGEHNDVFHPDTTRRSCEWLRCVNPGVEYRREVVEGYCHLDCWLGKDADRDVWPMAALFLDPGRETRSPAHVPSLAVSPSVLEPDIVILGWTRYLADGTLVARIFAQAPEHERRPARRGLISAGGKVHAHVVREGIMSPWFVADVALSPTGERVPDRARVIEVGTWHPPSPRSRLARGRIGRRLPRLPAAYRAKYGRGEQLESREGVWDGLQNAARVVISSRLASALRCRSQLSFFVGSCRWPGSAFERDASDSIYAGMLGRLAQIEQDAAEPCPSFALLVGDQIYIDATAGLFDTGNIRERFRRCYEQAFGKAASPNFARLVRRLPTYMALDNHEIHGDWTRSWLVRSAERFRWRIAKLAFRQYQWSHSPRNGELEPSFSLARDTAPPASDPTLPSHGEFPLWYTFESSGFPVFVMDTRSERDARHAARPNGQGVRLVSERQMRALERWLTSVSATGSRPKFIVSGIPLFPMLREPSREAAHACRDNGWHGHPATRDRMLNAILDLKLQNVVFIAGDTHCAMSARVHLTDGYTKLDAYCVTASALYAPLSFANLKPRDFLPQGQVSFGTGRWASYELVYDKHEFFTARNFTQLTVTPEGHDWRIDADIYDETGAVADSRALRSEAIRIGEPGTIAADRHVPALDA